MTWWRKLRDRLGWPGARALAGPACLLLVPLGSIDLHLGGKALSPGFLGEMQSRW